MTETHPTAPSPTPYVGTEHVGQEIICVEHLWYTYPDGTTALQDVNLHVTTGSTLAVVGPNGAGKTTLLKVLLGLLADYRGRVRVRGVSPHDLPPGSVTWVPQRQNVNWDFPVSVRQVTRMGLVGKTGRFRRRSREDLDHVEHILQTLGMAGIAGRPIGDLSGGQQQLAIIARALAPKPAILMLDEPTVGLDKVGQQRFRELTDTLRQQFGVTLVVVSHDLNTALSTCQRVACLNRSLHFHDAPERLTASLLSEVFQCSIEGLLPHVHPPAEEST
jgi:zinc transport system ATP-binding protein